MIRIGINVGEAVQEDKDFFGAAVQMTAPPGTTIVAEGDPATHFFNISSGTARMVKLLPRVETSPP